MWICDYWGTIPPLSLGPGTLFQLRLGLAFHPDSWTGLGSIHQPCFQFCLWSLLLLLPTRVPGWILDFHLLGRRMLLMDPVTSTQLCLLGRSQWGHCVLWGWPQLLSGPSADGTPFLPCRLTPVASRTWVAQSVPLTICKYCSVCGENF